MASVKKKKAIIIWQPDISLRSWGKDLAFHLAAWFHVKCPGVLKKKKKKKKKISVHKHKKSDPNNILCFIPYSVYHVSTVTTLLDTLSLQGASLL